MKTIPSILFFIAFLILSSCAEKTEMLTVIQADGSCYREFIQDVDSSFMVGDTSAKKNPFVVEVDSNWTVSWKTKSTSFHTNFPLKASDIHALMKNLPDSAKPTFTVKIHRNFKSVDDMAANFKLKASHVWSDLPVRYGLTKKFRWFYTFYSYKETYPVLKTGFNIPTEKYMTGDEAKFWFTGEPNMLSGMNGLEIREYVGDLEKKYNLWLADCSWSAEFKVLLKHYDQIGQQPVSKDSLALLKDPIFETVEDPTQDFKMEKLLNKYFKTNVFSVLWNTTDAPMKKYEDSLDQQPFMKYFLASFTYKLQMPGTIVSHNNAAVKENILIYTLTAERMFKNDYTIEAESRKTNVWAFILTALIALVALGSCFYKPKKKN